MALGTILRNRVRERVKERIENSNLGDAITTAAQIIVSRDDNTLTARDIPAIKETIKDAVAKEAPEQANAEPWYMNRVKVGLGVMAIAPLARLLGIDFNLTDGQEADLTIVMMALGGGIAAFGEWFSRKLRAIDWSSPLTWIVTAGAVAAAVAAYVWLI